MKYTKPYYYDKFKCIASKCTDTCCAGWEIDIDDDTYEMYQKLDGEVHELINENICVTNEGAHFKLSEGDRCPFLTEEGLCKLILTGGDELLCDICREHPRFYEWFGEYTEVGLGLCCEEACRLLFENESPLTFITIDDGIVNDCYIEENDEELIGELLEARNTAYGIVGDREQSLADRICNLLDFVNRTQSDIFGKNKANSAELDNSEKDVLLELLHIMKRTEPIDDLWYSYVDTLLANYQNIRANINKYIKETNERQFEYEHLLMYLLYRYFMKSLWDKKLFARTCFCIINLAFLLLCDVNKWINTGEYSNADRIELTKYWSKQVEYSDINMEFLLNECENNPAFSVYSLKCFIKNFCE